MNKAERKLFSQPLIIIGSILLSIYLIEILEPTRQLLVISFIFLLVGIIVSLPLLKKKKNETQIYSKRF